MAWNALPFQSTLSVRRATRVIAYAVDSFFISIHALRKESDFQQAALKTVLDIFQSTLSVRRATRANPICVATDLHFNPRSP